MSRKSPHLAVEEFSGNHGPDLATVQQLKLRSLAEDLAATLRALLVSGVLVNDAGCITVKREKEASDV